MIENTEPEKEAWTQIGGKDERRQPSDGAVHYLQAEDRLYPNYLTWCLRSGRTHPVALVKFKTTVEDMAGHLGDPVTQKQHPKRRTSGIQGIKLLDAKGLQSH